MVASLGAVYLTWLMAISMPSVTLPPFTITLPSRASPWLAATVILRVMSPASPEAGSTVIQFSDAVAVQAFFAVKVASLVCSVQSKSSFLVFTSMSGIATP